MKTVRVVGFDPSLQNWGIVLADVDVDTLEFKVVDMKITQTESDKKNKKVVRKNSDDLRRAKELYKQFSEYCKLAKFAMVEVPIGSQSARSMASYGICIGVLSSCQIPMIEVTPTEVKLAGTNIKTATKSEMIESAMKEHPEAKWLYRNSKGAKIPLNDNEHLADAIFAIKAGLQTVEFKSALEMFKLLKD